MPLERIRIEAFRCLGRAELELDGRRSYIFGPNGAGKTSLLEAIYVLGRGRSFRTRQNRRLIQHGERSLAVYGEVTVAAACHRLGVRLGGDGLETRLDGVANVSVAELARVLPAHVIDPNVHQLIEGGPSKRRRFLDWGVFHVEQGFLDAWRRYRRALGQRNAALKSGAGADVWDQALIETGMAVHTARARYVGHLAPVVAGVGRTLMGRALGLVYRAGWPSGLGLAEALAVSKERDRALGATQVGPHRADLDIVLDARGVREEASRGQQKLIAACLVLAQVHVFAQWHGDGGVLLVDDPAAELDQSAFGALMSALEGLPAQLVLTGLSKAALPPAAGFPVFHVEQGKVAAVV